MAHRLEQGIVRTSREWEHAYTNIKLQGANFVRFKPIRGGHRVVTNARMELADLGFRRFHPSTPQVLIAWLRRRIQVLPFHRSSIITSRGWAAPSESKSDPVWRNVGGSDRGGIKHWKKILKGYHIDCEGDKNVAYFTVPNHLLDSLQYPLLVNRLTDNVLTALDKETSGVV
jgi:hypothetical protein